MIGPYHKNEIPNEQRAMELTNDNSVASDSMQPLVPILPNEYAHINATEFFPEFHPKQVLRFLKLFGPSKSSSLPQIWRGVKKRQERKLHTKDACFDPELNKENKKLMFRSWEINYGPDPSLDQLAEDDEKKLLQLIENKEIEDADSDEIEFADWRFGPAQLWYDVLGIPETGEGFNYGSKLCDKNKRIKQEKFDNEFSDDTFLMVSQVHWEDDIIWNGDDFKDKFKNKHSIKNKIASWMPCNDSRTAETYCQPSKGMPVFGTQQISAPLQIEKNKINSRNEQYKDDTWYSIFPFENEELVYGEWEKEIIWDVDKMNKILEPKILTLDPNDDNIIFGIPEDVDPALLHTEHSPQPKVKINHPHIKKSKLLLGKAGIINILEEETPPASPKFDRGDPFNISNDSFYTPVSDSTLKLKIGGNIIKHSTPVVELRAPFIPTHIGPGRLKNFHRPPIKRYSHGSLASHGPHGVLPLSKHIKKKAKLREKERISSGGGDIFFMRSAEDLTGRDGELVLFEFSEEYPPLINQVGMCSLVKNYYKRKATKDAEPPNYKYGETAYAFTSPFLGVLSPGQSVQAIENNMYRAPIYDHVVPETDFLIIRTRQQYYIREIDALFVCGQECPFEEVPGPNSKKANNFIRDFLQVYIYRQFQKSRETPPRIKMDDIKKAFPLYNENNIRKRLKLCADFKRTGIDFNCWVLKPDFRLPSEEEISAVVTPEQCCAYFSMLAAEQRLKDAGYGEKFLLTPQEEDEDEDMQLKIDDEVKVAPWNTTRAYIQAMKGKCLLQLTGPADPTGCGEGFSYIRRPNKQGINKEDQEAQMKRLVTGTDADLRRLSLNNAKTLLRKFGVPEEDIKKLSRWEIIDVVRTMSTEKTKAGEESMSKFSRINRFSISEQQAKYKEECQRIFNLQNRVLSSHEILSTDEGETSDEEFEASDIEKMSKDIENLLSNKKTKEQISLEVEEQQRIELKKMMMNDESGLQENKSKRESKSKNLDSNSQSNRILKITRTFRNAEGFEYNRVEIVRNQSVIDTYLKIHDSNDEQFIKQFAILDDVQKEEMKRERRRIQEQLRRIKRTQERDRANSKKFDLNQNRLNTIPQNMFDFIKETELSTNESNTSNPSIQNSKLKCNACGQFGHLRTNKTCPLYQPDISEVHLMDTEMTEVQLNKNEKFILTEDQGLVNVDGTKVKLSSKLIKHHEEMKRQALAVKVPKDVTSKKRKRIEDDVDYGKQYKRPAGVNRRRTDPAVVLSTIFEDILYNMRNLPEVTPFMLPVTSKVAPDYSKIISRPMDLQTIRENLRHHKYLSREDFLADVNQIVLNSQKYNGTMSSLTLSAASILEFCIKQITENEERIMRLEKAINPLLDDDDQVAFTYILHTIVNDKLKTMQEATHFIKPVNKKMVKNYYNIIKNPMDLETISKKVAAHKYHRQAEFIEDIELIVNNCRTFNGKTSSLTSKAEVLLDVTKKLLKEYDADNRITQLEENMARVQQHHLEQADIDSSWNEENYTTNENIKKANSSKPSFEKLVEESEYIDVEGSSIEPELFGKPVNILEEDLQCSSEDEFDELPFGDFQSSELNPLIPVEVQPDELTMNFNSEQVAPTVKELNNVYLENSQSLLVEEKSTNANNDLYNLTINTSKKMGFENICSDLNLSESD